jgi:hypothetical protein
MYDIGYGCRFPVQSQRFIDKNDLPFKQPRSIIDKNDYECVFNITKTEADNMIEGSADSIASGKLLYGMVGGGQGAFIGDVHRKTPWLPARPWGSTHSACIRPLRKWPNRRPSVRTASTLR